MHTAEGFTLILTEIRLHRLSLPLREPFRAAYGETHVRHLFLVEAVTANGARGVAECVAMADPLYIEETTDTAWWAIRRYFAAEALAAEWTAPAEIRRWAARLDRYRGHRMAKAAVEMAVWDAWCAEHSVSLAQLLGVARTEVPAGISIGIQPDVDTLLRKVESALAAGYSRIKLKIQPGWDVEPIAAVRRHFGDVPLMADANSAYTRETADRLVALDDFALLMMEQPLGWDDLVDHAWLQRRLATPLCLDESIRSADDVRRAAELGACRVINLKPGRVGGFTASLAIHDLCRQLGLDLWCGGMYETGVGRLHNTILSGLPGFTLPGDTGPGTRYYAEDLVDPPVEFHRPGWLPVEPVCGLADRVVWRRVEQHRTQLEVIRRDDL